MTTRDVLNTWMSQVDGHGKNTILTFPNCQIVKNHEEVENLKLSENSFSFDKSMSFVGNGPSRNIWLFSDQVKARDMNRADSALIWLDKGILNQQSCIFQQHNNSCAFCIFLSNWLTDWLTRVILILMKFGISISTWFQVVPFCSPISEQFLFLLYDHSFRCP